MRAMLHGGTAGTDATLLIVGVAVVLVAAVVVAILLWRRRSRARV